MPGEHIVLMTLYCGLQLVLSKTISIGTLYIIFSVVSCEGVMWAYGKLGYVYWV